VGSGTLHVRLHDPEQRPEAQRVLHGVLGDGVQPDAEPAALSARTSDPERAAVALAELARAGIAVAELSLGQPSLDEVFLALTGHPADDARTTEDAA
jgi:ABC-2 type transport system ATP-binding protein